MNPETRLEAMVNTLAAIDDRLDDDTRAAIGARLTRIAGTARGEGRFVGASVPPSPLRATPWRRVGLAAIAAVAVAAALTWWLARDHAGDAEQPAPAGVPNEFPVTPPPPRPTPAPTTTTPPPGITPLALSPSELAAGQITGDRNMFPDDATKQVIAMSGKDTFLVPVEVCVAPSGSVSSVKVLRSSGFASYDRRLIDGISTWRYRPFLDAHGVATQACGQVNFSYRQR